jgi:hypothetical protein
MSKAVLQLAPPERVAWKKPVLWLLSAIGIVIGLRFFVLYAGHYLTNFSEASYMMYWPVRGYLLTHVIGGSLALLTGPFQIWSGLRRRVLKAHRALGVAYLAGTVIGSSGAYYMAAVSPLRTFGISLIALATAWLATTGMAFIAIKKRRIDIHKEWMVRSYVITYAFVTFRVIDEMNLSFFANLGMERYATIGWLCWTVPLFCTEMVFQWRRMSR